jgi:1,4-alpha-glucan branching enzyme
LRKDETTPPGDVAAIVEGRHADLVAAIVEGRHADPFGILGMHEAGREIVVRVFLPWARRVEVIDAQSGAAVASLPKIHEAGFFAGPVGRRQRFLYRLRAEGALGWAEFEDIYRFPPVLGDLDLHLLGEGNHPVRYA